MIYVVADTHGADVTAPPSFAEDDILIHLGDYVHGIFNLYAETKKYLIIGNHDLNLTACKAVFDLACQGLLLDHIWYTHEPAFSLPLGAHYNVHGHIHENDYEDYGYIKKPFHRRVLPNKIYSLAEVISGI